MVLHLPLCAFGDRAASWPVERPVAAGSTPRLTATKAEGLASGPLQLAATNPVPSPELPFYSIPPLLPLSFFHVLFSQQVFIEHILYDEHQNRLLENSHVQRKYHEAYIPVHKHVNKLINGQLLT